MRKVVQTTDGRSGGSADVNAYDAVSGNQVGSDETDRNGVFRISAFAPVKLVFSGQDPDPGDSLATEWFNDK